MFHPYIPIQAGTRLKFDEEALHLLLQINEVHVDWPKEGNRLSVSPLVSSLEEFEQLCKILAQMHGLNFRSVENDSKTYKFVVYEFVEER